MTNEQGGRVEKKYAHLIRVSEDALRCLEHSCPPKGGYTDKIAKRLAKALSKVKGEG